MNKRYFLKRKRKREGGRKEEGKKEVFYFITHKLINFKTNYEYVLLLRYYLSQPKHGGEHL
jgi:hypothetical protein